MSGFKNKLINAQQLKQTSLQTREISSNVDDILKELSTSIQTAHDNGQYEIISELPITFDIPNMSNASAQRKVWYHVLSTLKLQGYTIALKMSNVQCISKISWVTVEEKTTIDRENQFIAQCRVTKF